MPHGPSYDTGDVVCRNDDMGPCGEVYQEDMRNLNIPNWAKILRGSGTDLLMLGLAIIGIILSSTNKNNEDVY